jgi:signal transduction histidine kinase
MRRRLLQFLVPLVVLLSVAAAVPLASYVASSASRSLFVSRSNDADKFVDVSEAPLQTGDTGGLRDLAVRYDELYDTPVLIVDVDRVVVATSRSGMNVNQPPLKDALDKALRGGVPPEPDGLWPWRDEDMIVARPVVNDGQVLGAAVLVVPTGAARDQVTNRLLILIAMLVIGVAAVVAAIVHPISRWALRPLADLDDATHEIARGALDTRVRTDGTAPELRRLGDSFNSMAQSLNLARQRERDFIADASHQLRTPLTSARIHVEGLSERLPVARLALADIDRLGQIVQRLSRLTSADDRPGGGKHRSAGPDLATAVSERLLGWQSVYDAEELELRTGEMTPGPVAAELEVDDILDVLLDNAAKYGGTPVEVSVLRDGDEMVLRVEDHGTGLSDEDLQMLGERFFRSASHRDMPGTGLGLAIVRAEAGRVGGRVVAARGSSGGLVIEVRLPALAPV